MLSVELGFELHVEVTHAAIYRLRVIELVLDTVGFPQRITDLET
jgi:hypothetical protein